MVPIQNAIASYLPSLEKNCHKDTHLSGICEKEHFLARIYRRITRAQDARTEHIATQFLKAMQSLDFVRINVDIDGEIDLETQTVKYDSWLESSKRVEKILRKYKSHRLKELANKIEAQRASMMYRLEQCALDEHPDQGMVDKVYDLARAWKKHHPHLPDYGLTRKDKENLKRLCQYGDYCEAFLKSKDLQDQFFKWIIRDKNDVDSFVQYIGVIQWLGPIITKKLRSTLHIRNHNGVKELTLPFEYKRKNILNKRFWVQMGPDYKIPFRDIMDCFNNENNEIGPFEYCPPDNRGFTNFHIHKFATFDGKKYTKIDVNKDKWWEQVPVTEQFTIEEAKKMLGDEMDGEKSAILLRATREDQYKRNVDKTHGWVAFMVPAKNKSGVTVYNVYNFGKFTHRFPNTIWKLLKFFGNTVLASIALDKNPSYTWRQSTYFGLPIDEKFVEYGFKLVAKSIEDARSHKLVFQFQSKGCARWVQSIFNRVLHKAGHAPRNCFKAKVVNSIPTQAPISWTHTVMRMSPRFCQNFMIRLMMIPFFPWRECNNFSLTKSKLWNSQTPMRFYNPTVLFERQERELRGLRKKDKETLIPKVELRGFLRKIQKQMASA